MSTRAGGRAGYARPDLARDGLHRERRRCSVQPRWRRYMIASRTPLPDSSASEPSGLKIRSEATKPRLAGRQQQQAVGADAGVAAQSARMRAGVSSKGSLGCSTRRSRCPAPATSRSARRRTLPTAPSMPLEGNDLLDPARPVRVAHRGGQQAGREADPLGVRRWRARRRGSPAGPRGGRPRRQRPPRGRGRSWRDSRGRNSGCAAAAHALAEQTPQVLGQVLVPARALAHRRRGEAAVQRVVELVGQAPAPAPSRRSRAGPRPCRGSPRRARRSAR